MSKVKKIIDEVDDEVDDALHKLVENIEKNKDDPELKVKLAELTKSVDDYKHRHDDARKYGKRIGQGIVKKYKATPIKHEGKIYHDKGIETDEASAAIAEILFQCYINTASPECSKLLNDWIHEKLWGKIIMQYIPKLEEVWQYLHDNKYTKNNTLGYGDIDGAIWVEYPRQENSWPDKRKFIIHTSYCTCADDNTHIFIFNEDEANCGTILHVRTVWPKENSRGGYRVKKSKKNPQGWFSWGDDRDIKKPSLNTYRKRNFEFLYQGGRDKGYVLSLSGHGIPEIKGAQQYQGRIQHVIYIIDHMKLIITDESYQCK